MIRMRRVSALLPDITQQIHSLRASGVISAHTARAVGAPMIAMRRSAGILCIMQYYQIQKMTFYPRLHARALPATPKKSFALRADFPYSTLCAPLGSESHSILLGDMDSNHDSQLQRLLSYH